MTQVPLPRCQSLEAGQEGQGHSSAGKSALGITEATSPGQKPTQGQERSGGAPERPETFGPTPHSPKLLTGGLESEFRPERTATRSPAGKAPGQSSAGVSSSPLPSEEASGTTTHSSVKRKVRTQGNLSPESGKTLKTPGGEKDLGR